MSQAAVAKEVALEPAQYLTFQLEKEVYALGILSVKEIIEYGTLTTVPMMPETIRGVINLRGAVLPVIDLSARFGRPPSPVTKKSCIVIVEQERDGERQDLGLVVDAVNAVVEIPASEIAPPPSFGTRIPTDFIAGMGKMGAGFVIILSIEHVLSTEDLVGLNGVANSAGAEAAA